MKTPCAQGIDSYRVSDYKSAPCLRARLSSGNNSSTAWRSSRRRSRGRGQPSPWSPSERDKLRRAYEQLKEQLELLRRRIHVAKAERIDATQLQTEFAQTQAKLDALATQLDEGVAPMPASESPCDPADPPSSSVRPKPTGRRNLATEDLPEERVEIIDPALEGTVERIGFEESCKLKYGAAVGCARSSPE